MIKKQPLYTISQAAKFCGVSVKTLRYYQDIGLIEPEIIDKSSNYRYYSDEQIGLLGMIIGLKEADFSISEIKEFFKVKNTNYLEEKISEKILKTQAEILRLTQFEQKLKTRKQLFEKARLYRQKRIDNHLQPEIRTIPARKMIFVGGRSRVTFGEISKRFLEIIQLSKKHSIMLHEHFLTFHERYSEIERNPIEFEACCIVEDGDLSLPFIKPIPENLYVIFPFEGKWTDSIALYQRIGDWFLSNPYHPVGPLEMIFLQSYIHTQDKNFYSADIQIPIHKNFK